MYDITLEYTHELDPQAQDLETHILNLKLLLDYRIHATQTQECVLSFETERDYMLALVVLSEYTEFVN